MLSGNRKVTAAWFRGLVKERYICRTRRYDSLPPQVAVAAEPATILRYRCQVACPRTGMTITRPSNMGIDPITRLPGDRRLTRKAYPDRRLPSLNLRHSNCFWRLVAGCGVAALGLIDLTCIAFPARDL
jgi:hypothetical protein